MVEDGIVGQGIPDGGGGDEEQKAVDIELGEEGASIPVNSMAPGPEVGGRRGGKTGSDRALDSHGGDRRGRSGGQDGGVVTRGWGCGATRLAAGGTR